MIYYLTSGVFCYAKRSTKQTIYAGIQENWLIETMQEENIKSMQRNLSVDLEVNEHEIESNHGSESIWRKGRKALPSNGVAAAVRVVRQSSCRKQVEEDLLAEVQRLRAENDYLKNLQALVLEDERHQHKKRW